MLWSLIEVWLKNIYYRSLAFNFEYKAFEVTATTTKICLATQQHISMSDHTDFNDLTNTTKHKIFGFVMIMCWYCCCCYGDLGKLSTLLCMINFFSWWETWNNKTETQNFSILLIVSINPRKIISTSDCFTNFCS